MKVCFSLHFLFLCALMATYWNTVDARTLKTKKMSKKGGDRGNECEIADESTGYIYQRMANSFLTEVDNIANEDVDDLEEFYATRVEALSTPDVVWDIDAGARKFQLEGTENVKPLWVDSFSTREFAFHQWSHWEVCTHGTKVEAACRYHGVVREDGGNYQDIFGVIRVTFNKHDIINNVFVQRFHTIGRPY